MNIPEAPVDLTRLVQDPKDGSWITLDTIARKCHIAWEGTAELANMYAEPPSLLMYLMNSVFTLRELIAKVADFM
uniref:Uncharacterized protein n=1 Tax=Globisporangium ultimum (strain ATCC 200006 / CBS 805.95 / DAOM BR144) TaxID=431595 RepID=K3WDI5_GLOUD